MTEINPCSFKRHCKACTAALLSDRPHLCIDLECGHYTPCTRCKMNRILDENGLCNVCVKGERTKKEIVEEQKPIKELASDGTVIETTKEIKDAVASEEITEEEAPALTRRLSISRPGEPPPEFSDNEKEIYLSEWAEYTGFYRDPTSKSILHSIIILQIELNWVLNETAYSRGAPKKELEQQRTRLIRNLKELRDQLPEKEANEESDDEKFLSMVYEKYTAEMQERRVGKVSRILSPEAIALAPVLHFPLDPQGLLTNLGYRLIDAAAACDHIILDDLPKDPKKLLEFFGFFIDEKYALPLNTSTLEDEEEPLPAVASPELLSTHDTEPKELLDDPE